MTHHSTPKDTDSEEKKAVVSDGEYAWSNSLERHDDAIVETEGDIFKPTENGPDFRGLSWIGAAALIAKSQIGLGVLAIPATFETLGFAPGLISLVVLSIITTFAGLYAGTFRRHHPSVHTIGDVAYLMFGRYGREVVGWAFWLFNTLVIGAATLTFSIAINTISGGNDDSEPHICTVAWMGLAAGITLVAGTASPTMKYLSWYGRVGVVSIFVAIWTASLACAVKTARPAGVPDGAVTDKNIRAFAQPTFVAAINAVSNQVVSLSGTASFIPISAEMRHPQDFPRALYLGQGFVVANYIAVGILVYGTTGQYVTSPAIGSAGAVVAKVAYGIALPALLVSCIFQAHVSAKYTFVRILRNTRHLDSSTLVHWLTWLLSVLLATIVGFVVAGGVPIFGDLLGIMGALFGATWSVTLPGLMFLFLQVQPRGHSGARSYFLRWFPASITTAKESKAQALKVASMLFCILAGLFISIAGTYGAIDSIVESYKTGAQTSAFQCKS